MIKEQLWNEISNNTDYKEWAAEHDAFEQIAIVHSWCDFEFYDVSELCKDASEVVALYAYLHFVLGIEFMNDAAEMAQDKHFEFYSEDEVRKARFLMVNLKL